MPITIGSLATGQLAAAKATIYTCPALTTAIVRLVKMVNTGAAANAVNLYVKEAAGTSRRLWPVALSMPSGYEAKEDGVITLSAGDVLEGDATVANEVDYSIFGVERT